MDRGHVSVCCVRCARSYFMSVIIFQQCGLASNGPIYKTYKYPKDSHCLFCLEREFLCYNKESRV